MFTSIFVLFCAFVCSTTFASPASILLIDPTNHLWEVHEAAFIQEIPKRHGISYALTHWTTDIQGDFEAFLAKFGVQQGASPLLTRGQNNNVLPLIIVDWLRGTLSHAQFVQRIRNNSRDKIFVDIAEIAFHPHKLAQHTRLRPGSHQFIAACADKVGSSRLYLVGNWDPESFNALTNIPAFQQLLQYFPRDHRLISGLTHQILPTDLPLLVHELTTRLNLTPHQCVFITAMPYHARRAQELNMRTIVVNGDLTAALAQLDLLLSEQAAS